jgi:dethiobiotin synthetase
VAEGAGGILVPLDGGTTMLDLARAFGLPAVVVARATLGTINHTLLTVRELGRGAVPVAGIVLCDARPVEHGLIERDNRETIARLTGIPVLGHLPYLGDLERAPPDPGAFARQCASHLPDGGALAERLGARWR